jgi:hypothetical protein
MDKIDPVEFLVVQVLALLALATLIVLMFAMWRELRRLRETLYFFLSSNRENSRSLMAAIHEVGALASRMSKHRTPTHEEVD